MRSMTGAARSVPPDLVNRPALGAGGRRQAHQRTPVAPEGGEVEVHRRQIVGDGVDRDRESAAVRLRVHRAEIGHETSGPRVAPHRDERVHAERAVGRIALAGRRIAIGVFGPERSAEILGTPGSTAPVTEGERLWRQAKDTVERLEAPDFIVPVMTTESTMVRMNSRM